VPSCSERVRRAEGPVAYSKSDVRRGTEGQPLSTGSFWSLDAKAFPQFRQLFVNANPAAAESHGVTFRFGKETTASDDSCPAPTTLSSVEGSSPRSDSNHQSTLHRPLGVRPGSLTRGARDQGRSASTCGLTGEDAQSPLACGTHTPTDR